MRYTDICHDKALTQEAIDIICETKPVVYSHDEQQMLAKSSIAVCNYICAMLIERSDGHDVELIGKLKSIQACLSKATGGSVKCLRKKLKPLLAALEAPASHDAQETFDLARTLAAEVAGRIEELGPEPSAIPKPLRRTVRRITSHWQFLTAQPCKVP